MRTSSHRTALHRPSDIKVSDWDRIGVQYARVRDTRRDTVFPLLWDQIRHLDARTVLDYGGGDGTFSLARPSKLSVAISIFEPSPMLRSIAAQNTSGLKHIRVTGEPKSLRPNEFDVVTLNAVWMSLATKSACIALLRKIHGYLKKDGVLLASVTHPCFRDVVYSTFRTTFRNEWYLQSGRSFQVRMSDGSNEVILEDTHWKLSDMFCQLADAHFVVRRAWEVPDIKLGRKRHRGVPWLVLECLKLKP